jgi:alpha-L-rhamnosidase
LRELTFFFILIAGWGFSGISPVESHPLPVAKKLLDAQWPAAWIAAADGPERDSGVFHFRKTLSLKSVPPRFLVHVSADNRYLLHVNGQRVGMGPARSDLLHWQFETYDLTPFLHMGENLLAATVWNFGTQSPMAQMSRRTGFILQGDDDASTVANTNPSWEAALDPGHRPNSLALKSIREHYFYYAAAPGEQRLGDLYDWNWDSSLSHSPRWRPAISIGQGHPCTIREGPPWMLTPEGWLLMPSSLPPMEYLVIPVGQVIRNSGAQINDNFPDSGTAVVPGHSHARLLLDRKDITNAFPELLFSGGKGAVIRLTYAEALYDSHGEKGNRNQIEGKTILGVYDEIMADGEAGRSFIPLWFRTWRFLEVEVETAEQPLTLKGLKAFFTAYPLVKKAQFESQDPLLQQIWAVGWRTARLAAHETYMDAPYWEQLQYVGDTRIDALISYAMSGDDTLARRAIQLFSWSRQAEGITQSRYPTAEVQYIPPYALFWVCMLHDFWMYRDDPEFIREQLPGSRAVLDWFLERQRPDGLLGFLPFWVHGDTGTSMDTSIQDREGRSGLITIQFLDTLRKAAELEEALGEPSRAIRYRRQADMAADAVSRLWDPEHGLMADTPERKSWGHPVNIFALYCGLVPPAEREKVMSRVIDIAHHPAGRSAAGQAGSAWPLSEIPSASFYFRFYLGRALETCDAVESYLDLLDPWKQALSMGLTTWPEHPEPSRSDCHAWSAHPNFDFLRLVAGIKPSSPGFKTVRIEPNLGGLKTLSAAMPSPSGVIKVAYRVEGNSLQAEIFLPEKLSGEFFWKGNRNPLKPGAQKIQLTGN